jgi:hypothetical protein
VADEYRVGASGKIADRLHAVVQWLFCAISYDHRRRWLNMHWFGVEAQRCFLHVIGALFRQPQPGFDTTLHTEPRLYAQRHFGRDLSPSI